MFKVFAVDGTTHDSFTAFAGREFSRAFQSYLMNKETKYSLKIRDIPCLLFPSGPFAQPATSSTWYLAEVTMDKRRAITVEEWSSAQLVHVINTVMKAVNLKIFPEEEYTANSYTQDGLPVLTRKIGEDPGRTYERNVPVTNRPMIANIFLDGDIKLDSFPHGIKALFPEATCREDINTYVASLRRYKEANGYLPAILEIPEVITPASSGSSQESAASVGSNPVSPSNATCGSPANDSDDAQDNSRPLVVSAAPRSVISTLTDAALVDMVVQDSRDRNEPSPFIRVDTPHPLAARNFSAVVRGWTSQVEGADPPNVSITVRNNSRIKDMGNPANIQCSPTIALVGNTIHNTDIPVVPEPAAAIPAAAVTLEQETVHDNNTGENSDIPTGNEIIPIAGPSRQNTSGGDTPLTSRMDNCRGLIVPRREGQFRPVVPVMRALNTENLLSEDEEKIAQNAFRARIIANTERMKARAAFLSNFNQPPPKASSSKKGTASPKKNPKKTPKLQSKRKQINFKITPVSKKTKPDAAVMKLFEEEKTEENDKSNKKGKRDSTDSEDPDYTA